MNSIHDTLLIFIKNPIKGQVKTRLASSVGHEEALRIYEELLTHTRKACNPLEVNKKVYYSHFIDTTDTWNGMGFHQQLQCSGNLGERMNDAFKTSFEESKKVVIIGSDCPQINTALIQTAFDALDNNSIVLGPTHDGGYYLLGMNQYFPNLFEDIEWSSPEVLEQTISKAKENGINPSILPTLSDVDYIEDWLKYGW